jgi:cystathionine gamma-synthase
MDDFGGMVSFELAGSEDGARRVVEATRLFKLAESLGGVESLVELPGPMTHATLAGSSSEIPGNLVRLSVGIEDATDLVADLEQALARAG